MKVISRKKKLFFYFCYYKKHSTFTALVHYKNLGETAWVVVEKINTPLPLG